MLLLLSLAVQNIRVALFDICAVVFVAIAFSYTHFLLFAWISVCLFEFCISFRNSNCLWCAVCECACLILHCLHGSLLGFAKNFS